MDDILTDAILMGVQKATLDAFIANAGEDMKDCYVSFYNYETFSVSS